MQRLNRGSGSSGGLCDSHNKYCLSLIFQTGDFFSLAGWGSRSGGGAGDRPSSSRQAARSIKREDRDTKELLAELLNDDVSVNFRPLFFIYFSKPLND